jgi:predicted glycosyltransferase
VILYYALGGGLGHLTRARKVIAALGLEDVAILTASRHAGDRRVTGGHRIVPVPPSLGRNRPRFVEFLREIVSGFDELIVDSFPGGILGELTELELPPTRHISRRLRWEIYNERVTGPLPEFTAVYALEPGGLPGQPLALPHADPGPPLLAEPHWLVIHSGPRRELDTLLGHAEGAPRTLVISPRDAWIYPIAPHLGHAERIITAAGFNLMHETEPFRDRHIHVPFERVLDNQFARSAAAQ